eukprot:3284226-Pleurochrysis_carterae.AAC.1
MQVSSVTVEHYADDFLVAQHYRSAFYAPGNDTADWQDGYHIPQKFQAWDLKSSNAFVLRRRA